MYNTQFIGNEMYFDTHLDYRNQVMNDFIENEMQRHKNNAIHVISGAVHFKIDSFSRVLAYSFIEENEDAVNLARQMNLGKLEFLAVLEDIDGFKDEYLKDLELAQNF